METTGIKTNATIVPWDRKITKFLVNIKSTKLKSEIIDLKETKSLLSKLNDTEFIFGFDRDGIEGDKKDVLKFLDDKFNKEDMAFVAKYEVYKGKNGKVNYLWLYENYYTSRSKNEIIFFDHSPLTGLIVYCD